MNNETAKITATPYLAGTVNHATKNNTVKITVAPYLAGTVNHATMDETVKITDYINLARGFYFDLELVCKYIETRNIEIQEC